MSLWNTAKKGSTMKAYNSFTLLADVIVIKRLLLATSKMKSTLGGPESKSINFISPRFSSHLGTVLRNSEIAFTHPNYGIH